MLLARRDATCVICGRRIGMFDDCVQVIVNQGHTINEKNYCIPCWKRITDKTELLKENA